MARTTNLDKQLFQALDRAAQAKYKQFALAYAQDSKQFINKILRDYEASERFPVHVLQTIKSIPKSKYDSAVCILRGGLPYSLLFEADGWKMHYVVCGRKNEEFGNLRFDATIDPTLKKIQGKKVLLIENNSHTGNSPGTVANELTTRYKIQQPDLFLDYFCPGGSFSSDKDKLAQYSRIYVAREADVASEAERQKLIKEFLTKLEK